MAFTMSWPAARQGPLKSTQSSGSNAHKLLGCAQYPYCIRMYICDCACLFVCVCVCSFPYPRRNTFALVSIRVWACDKKKVALRRQEGDENESTGEKEERK